MEEKIKKIVKLIQDRGRYDEIEAMCDIITSKGQCSLRNGKIHIWKNKIKTEDEQLDIYCMLRIYLDWILEQEVDYEL